MLHTSSVKTSSPTYGPIRTGTSPCRPKPTNSAHGRNAGTHNATPMKNSATRAGRAIHGASHTQSGGSSSAVCSTAPSRKAGLSLAIAVKRYASVNCTCTSHTGHQSTSRSGRSSRQPSQRQARVAVDDRQQQQHQRHEVHVVCPEVLIHDVQADRHRTQHTRTQPRAMAEGERGASQHPHDRERQHLGQRLEPWRPVIQACGHNRRVVAEPVQVATSS